VACAALSRLVARAALRAADAPRRAQELAALKKHNAEMRVKLEEARGVCDAACFAAHRERRAEAPPLRAGARAQQSPGQAAGGANAGGCAPRFARVPRRAQLWLSPPMRRCALARPSRAEAAGSRAALRSAVAQAKSAREGMEADAKQAAELAERLGEVLTRNMEADMAQKHVAALQRAAAAAIAKSLPPESEGGAAEGASAAAPQPPPPESRVGSGDRGAGGA